MAVGASGSTDRGWTLRRRRRSWKVVGETLEEFDGRFPRAERLTGDPVQLAHGYSDPRDREVAALIASSLAFGRASLVIEAGRGLLDWLGPRPARHLTRAHRRGELTVPEGWQYRWLRRDDLRWFLAQVGRVLDEAGSLEAAFTAGDDGGPDLRAAMSAFANRLRDDGRPARRRLTHGAAYFVPSAEQGSTCKRLCLFLRWLIRPADGIDLGSWSGLDPARLTMPVDTHVARISAYVGLTERRTASWAMAREITENLARFRPDDPVSFDFALSQLGIMGSCPRRRQPKLCASCDLLPACRL
ncbi:MAG: TIGR02757 family protein [Acidobacteriota bacterium]